MYEFDQQRVSQYIALKKWDQCWQYLYEVLDAQSEGKISRDYVMQDIVHAEGIKKIYSFAEIVSKVFIALLTDDSVEMSDDDYINLIYKHEILHSIFYIISIDQTDSFVQQCYGGKKKLDTNQQKKLCLLLSLNTNLDIVKALENVSVLYRGIALTAYLSNRKNFWERHEANKIKLFALKADIQNMKSMPLVIHKFNHIYFNISYINHDQKHDIKTYINGQIRKYINANNHVLEENREPDKIPSDNDVKARKKPLLLMCSEHFRSDHSMYRAWRKPLRTLNKHFDVHLMSSSKNVDDMALKDFKHYFFTDRKRLDQIILEIEYLRPDVILMPSVGMDLINILLSNIRLAPLQVMALGHPATTMSKDMDFVLGQWDLYDAAAFKQDKYIIDPSPIEQHLLPFLQNLTIKQPQDTQPKNYVNVGIPGALQKLSSDFRQFLDKIYKDANFEIRFTFLTDAKGYIAAASKIYFLKKYPKSQFFGYQSYADYFARLQEVDIALFPFPFGHSNTVIDTLIAGKPCIGMDGTEPHSKTNGFILHRLGSKEQFLVNTIDEYEEKFYALCQEIMSGKRNFFDPRKVYDKMQEKAGDADFGAFMRWVYENAEAMKASKETLFEWIPEGDESMKEKAVGRG